MAASGELQGPNSSFALLPTTCPSKSSEALAPVFESGSRTQCAAACTAHPQCRGFDTDNRWCYLKRACLFDGGGPYLFNAALTSSKHRAACDSGRTYCGYARLSSHGIDSSKAMHAVCRRQLSAPLDSAWRIDAVGMASGPYFAAPKGTTFMASSTLARALTSPPFNLELHQSYAWLPVTHTTGFPSIGVWMYYGRGCSNIFWNCGKTIAGRHKLAVAAALMAEQDPSCSPECVANFFANRARTDPNGDRVAEVRRAATAANVHAALAWRGTELPHNATWPWLVALESNVQAWLLPVARSLGYDSMQFLMNPLPLQGEGPWRWHTELWDVREKFSSGMELDNSSFVRGLRCNEGPCRLKGADATGRMGRCLACEGCMDTCTAGSPPSSMGAASAAAHGVVAHANVVWSAAQQRATMWRSSSPSVPAPRGLTPLRKIVGVKELVVCQASPQRLLAFSHVFKAGGSTVFYWMRRICEWTVCVSDYGSCGYGEGIPAGSLAPYRNVEWGTHDEGALLRLNQTLPGILSHSTIWFTVVRNPLERFESSMRQVSYLCRHHNVSAAQSMKAAWLEHPGCRFSCSEVLSNARNVLQDQHFLQQVSFMHTPDGRAKLPFDYIFATEEMPQVENFIAQLAGRATSAGTEATSITVHALAHGSTNNSACSCRERKRVKEGYAADLAMMPWLQTPKNETCA